MITSPSDHLFRLSDPVYNAAEAFWKDARTQRRVGNLLVWGFLGALLLIELNRCSLPPRELGSHLPTNHFFAVSLAFSVLLGFEILGLVFVVPESVSDSLGKQFEILSIILLRESFQEFVNFDEPIQWKLVVGALLPIFVNAFGGLLTFITIGFFYRFQRHRRITAGKTGSAPPNGSWPSCCSPFSSASARAASGRGSTATRPANSSTRSSRCWCSATS